MWPFSDFRYSYRSSRSTADLLTVVTDRIVRAFNKSGAPQTVALGFQGFRQGLLHILKSCGTLGQIFVIISFFFSVIDGFEWF